MPTVFIVDGYRFFFFSNEGHEPVHVHVEKDNKYAKFWLKPLALARNYKFNFRELARIMRIVESRHNEIEEKWNEHFNKS